MMFRILAAAVGTLSLSSPGMAAECSPTAMEIRSVSEGGSTIELNDGSRWAVERTDQVFARVWLHAEKVLVCEGGLMKPNDVRPISAKRIQ